MAKGGNWNVQARRSGGDRRFRIEAGGTRTTPDLSIQCFEQRHHDCTGRDPLFGHECGCACHAPADTRK